MLRLSRRSVSGIISKGAVRHRNAVALVSSSPYSTAESDINRRWYSALTAGISNGKQSLTPFHLKNCLLYQNRFESTAVPSDASSEPPAETYEYQAEVSRLMDLIVNSLYSNKEVFLRELISNASDALDKLRFLSVTEPALMKDGGDLDIRIQTDKDNGIITITDYGIGMTRQDLVDCLGTIAQSGTAKFLQSLKESKDAGGDNNLIGQFGVGFYSAFLVSDRVVVSTKSPKSDKQYVLEGAAGAGSYSIREETDPEKLIPRGTRLTLYLKRDDKVYAHPERVQRLVKNYSQFVSFPIYTWQEKGFTKEIEVDEDPAEAKKDQQGDQVEVYEMSQGTVVILMRTTNKLLVVSDSKGTDIKGHVHFLDKTSLIGNHVLTAAGDVCIWISKFYRFGYNDGLTLEEGAVRIKRWWKLIYEVYEWALKRVHGDLVDEVPNIMDLSNAEYLLCGIEGGKPSVYRIFCEKCLFTKENQFMHEKLFFETYVTGSGSEYALPIVKAHENLKAAIDNCVKAVMNAIKHDPACGGDIILVLIEPGKAPKRFTFSSKEDVDPEGNTQV